MRRGLLLLVALPIAVTGCSSPDANEDSGGSGGSNGGNTITRSDLGQDWPLTVDGGELNCDGTGGTGEATITVDGTTYALNGLAKSNDDYADIQPIWADNPEMEGLKKDIGPLIDRALQLCE